VSIALLPRAALEAYIAAVGQEGWSDAALASAAEKLGARDFDVRRAIGQDVAARQQFFFSELERDMQERACAAPGFAALPVRTKIRTAVLAWIYAAEAMEGAKGAIRKAAANHMLSGNLAALIAGEWHIADAIWRLCGDRSADFNHYTKRMILSAVFVSVLLYWFSGRGDHAGALENFLDARIDNALKIGGAAGKTVSRLREKFSGGASFG